MSGLPTRAEVVEMMRDALAQLHQPADILHPPADREMTASEMLAARPLNPENPADMARIQAEIERDRADREFVFRLYKPILDALPPEPIFIPAGSIITARSPEQQAPQDVALAASSPCRD